MDLRRFDPPPHDVEQVQSALDVARLTVLGLARHLELVLMAGAHPGPCVDLEGLELAPGAPCPWHLAAAAQHQAEARQLLGQLRAQGWRW